MVGRMAALLILFAVVFFIIRAVSRVRRGLGPRLVTCPETMQPAIIEVAAESKELRLPAADRRLIRQCSRWPLRQDCGKECLT